MVSSAAEGFIQVKIRQSVAFTPLYISKLTEWGRRKLYLAMVVCFNPTNCLDNLIHSGYIAGVQCFLFMKVNL